MPDFTAEVKDIIRGHLPGRVENLSDDIPLKLLGMNSISFIKIVLNLEEVLQIEFADEELDLNRYTTVGSLLRYIGQKTG